MPRSVARELPGPVAKIPAHICRDVPSSWTDFPKHPPRKSTKNAPPRISTDSQKTLSVFPRAPQGTRPRILPGICQDPRSMCRHPQSTLNNLHKDSPGKSPKNAPRVSPNPRKDVARLSSERPMVVTNECPQDTPKIWPTPHKNFNSQGSLHYLPKDSPKQLPEIAVKIWPGPPKNLVTFPEESPRDLSRTPKDFAKLPKDSPRHVPRSPHHFARHPQGFPEAVIRDWIQRVAKISLEINRWSRAIPRAI